jgi:glycosyltransferase involved in cell wall biosynthesis
MWRCPPRAYGLAALGCLRVRKVRGHNDGRERRDMARVAAYRKERARRILLVVENVSLARDHRLRKQASSLLAAGYEVSVVCRSDPDNDALEGMRLHEYSAPVDAESKLGFLREYAYSWVMAAWHIMRAFRADRFDAVQISGTPDIYFTIGAPFKWLGRRLVLDQRDLSPELYEVRYNRRDAVYRVLCRLERMSYRCADHVITVNETLKETVGRRGGLPPDDVTVVGNGPVLASTRRDTPRPELKSGRRFLACWVGMMGPQDQVELALRAVAHVVHDLGRTDCHFVFIGDGESRQPAQALAAELGLTDFVAFPGWLGEQDVFAHLATADLGLEPNLEALVSPVKGMEYMAFGLPFVAFDVAETRRMAGGAAAYVPSGDVAAFARRIDELLADPDRRADMGQLGRQRVETELAWDHQQVCYLDVYKRLLDQPRRSRRRRRAHTSTSLGR